MESKFKIISTPRASTPPSTVRTRRKMAKMTDEERSAFYKKQNDRKRKDNRKEVEPQAQPTHPNNAGSLESHSSSVISTDIPTTKLLDNSNIFVIGQDQTSFVQRQTDRLYASLQEWYDIYNLHDIPNLCPPSQFLQDVADQTRILLCTGSISGYREILSLNAHTSAALEISNDLQGRFEDVLEYLEYGPLYTETILRQRRLHAVQTVLACKIQLVETLTSTWRSTPSPSLSSLLMEAVGQAVLVLPSNSFPESTLKRLSPKRYLNDTLIDHFLRSSKDSLAVSISPLFYTKYMSAASGTSSDHKSWSDLWNHQKGGLTKAVMNVQRILIPISKENHWVLICANLVAQDIQVLDSYRSNYNSSIGMHNWKTSIHAKDIIIVQNFLKDLRLRFRMDLEDIDLFTCTPHLKVPFQNNDYDCGLYTVMFARHLQTGDTINHPSVEGKHRIWENMADMDVFRLMLLEEIMSEV